MGIAAALFHRWPWLLMLVALALAAYGAFRDAAIRPLGALIGAYLVASLPLLDTHAALAGYADLMLAGVYTCAALALHRWVQRRDGKHYALGAALIPVGEAGRGFTR